MRRWSCSLVLLLWGAAVQATHIIGGELSYDHLSGSTYRVVLKLYRDAGPGNVNDAQYPDTAEIGVFNAATRAYLFSAFARFPGATTLPVAPADVCLAVEEPPVLEEAVYTAMIDLPPSTDGYQLAFQLCCRSPVIVNVLAPGSQGITCTALVPPAPQQANSSPRFIGLPPLVLCTDKDLNVPVPAMDPDGDSLVYGLATPFTGASAALPEPSPPAAPPYTSLPWAVGYTGALPMDASPALSLDPGTGLLTGHPTRIGSYTVCVMVTEYRDGLLLSQVRRDLRMDVVPCIHTVDAVIATPGACQPLTVTFANGSTGAHAWQWDFGVEGMDSDRSNRAEPTFTFPVPGSYVVTLVADPGAMCTDTAQVTVEVRALPEAYFTVDPPSPQLQGTPIQFMDGSLLHGAEVATAIWYVDGEAMSWNSLMPDWPGAGPGMHTIELEVTTVEGCSDRYALDYEISAGEVRIPNVFSPNGDGKNDRFIIENVQFHPNTLKVFNRWGMLVYEAVNYRNQWTGTGLLEGTYFYILSLGDDRERRGYVTLLR